jgi:hypothetical protein
VYSPESKDLAQLERESLNDCNIVAGLKDTTQSTHPIQIADSPLHFDFDPHGFPLGATTRPPIIFHLQSWVIVVFLSRHAAIV